MRELLCYLLRRTLAAWCPEEAHLKGVKLMIPPIPVGTPDAAVSVILEFVDRGDNPVPPPAGTTVELVSDRPEVANVLPDPSGELGKFVATFEAEEIQDGVPDTANWNGSVKNAAGKVLMVLGAIITMSSDPTLKVARIEIAGFPETA